jgi:hypothetical protein
MELLDDLAFIFTIASSIGALLGYISGWMMAVRGARTRYFQQLIHAAASSGRSRNEFALLIALRLALCFGVIACVGYVLLVCIEYAILRLYRLA